MPIYWQAESGHASRFTHLLALLDEAEAKSGGRLHADRIVAVAGVGCTVGLVRRLNDAKCDFNTLSSHIAELSKGRKLDD